MDARRRIVAATALLATLAPGCDRPPASRVLVTGTVIHDGVPLEGVDVRFYPEGPTAPGPRAVGRTGPGGRYALKTDRMEGVFPGTYRVQVAKGADPDDARVGGSLTLYGSVYRRVPPTGGVIDLVLRSEPQNDSY